MSETVMRDGSLCPPNISEAGVRRRMRFGAISSALTVLLAGSVIVSHARWVWSAAVFVPAFVAAIGFLQAGRRTCVSRAAEGTFEHEDFSKTPAAEDAVVRSREVATKIMRDSMLIGAGAVVITVVLRALR
jgi:hypothetical protein